jgi:hypothetical protein
MAAKDEEKSATPKLSPADEALVAKGELVGKVRGPDVDGSFHVYEFTDPKTGEPLKTERTVHDDSNYVK